MDIPLSNLKDIVAENCVTILMNTHRTRPENEKDPIVLKNLVKEAALRLHANENKRDAKALVERLEDLAAQVDHNHNQESLALFVNEDIAEYLQMPIKVVNRVVVDHTFATRDLVRAKHLETHYYVLVLNQQKVRLLHAFNDQLVAEIREGFPIENDQFYSTNSAERSNASRQSHLMAEFFNRVDKVLNKVRKSKPMPVLICSEESNYHEYLKIADQKQSIYGTCLNSNYPDDKEQVIITESWEIVKGYVKDKNEARKAELQQAVSQNQFLSDTNEIWQAIQQGKIQTLFIEKGKFQAARMEGGQIQHISDDLRDAKDVIDDIYDELIRENMNHGGDVVFLNDGELAKFNGFGAVTRY